MKPLDLPHLPRDLAWPIVVGVDPGTQVVGYGAIVLREPRPALLAAGVLRATRGADVPTRLGEIRGALDDLFSRLRPSLVVVEHAFSGENVASALRIGEGRGVALSCAAIMGAEIAQYTPAVVKRTLTGNGGSDKEAVAQMVARELGLEEPPRPHDATDALALALTHVHRSELGERIQLSKQGGTYG